MPTITFETDPSRRNRRRLQQLAASVTKNAHQAHAARRQGHIATQSLEDLERRHPDLVAADLRTKIHYWVCLIGLVGVYVFDLTLSSPTFVYFAQRFLNYPPSGVEWWKYILPLGVLLIEIMLSVTRAHLTEHILPGESRLPLHACNLLALCEAFVMVCLVAAAQLSLMPRAEASAAVTYGYWLKTFGVVAFALVLHGSVLLLGRSIQSALAYLLCAAQRNQLRRELRVADATRRRKTQDAIRVFGVYLNERASVDADSPGTSTNIPFDRETVGVLNPEFERPVIRTDATGDSNEDDAPRAEPPQGPDGDPSPHEYEHRSGAEAEAEYYRTIVNAHARQQEEEVKA